MIRDPLHATSPTIRGAVQNSRHGQDVLSRRGDVFEQEADRSSARAVSGSTTNWMAAPGIGKISSASPECWQGSGMARVKSVLSSAGQPMPSPLIHDMAQRFGHDFARVRIHTDATAAASARDLGAKAYTVGSNIVFGPNRFQPASSAGRRLIGHELTHVIQQSAGHARLQRDLEDPDRLATVHENVRVAGPPRPTAGGGTAARRPWVDPGGSNGGTAEVLFRQAYRFLDDRTFDRTHTEHTTDANLDSDAVAMHQRVLSRFPQIASPLADAEIQSRVGLLEPATIRNDRDYLRSWLDNSLPQMSRSGDYAIDDRNPSYIAMLDRLTDNPDVGSKIVTLAAGQSAYTHGEGASRQVFVHRRVEEGARRLTLIHELVHFYRHDRYADWVAASRDLGLYNEGLTEWLARLVMTPDERADRTSYQDRMDVVQAQIAEFVPEDDIAKAFFMGEVWRLETRSAESRNSFEAATGISETAPEADQRVASRSGPGIFQTVESSRHYRFLNLGFDDVQPKQEHVAGFRNVKSAHIDTDPAVKVRFVGHASSAGSLEVNERLSRRRSAAFYQLARRERLGASRLLDVGNPPHHGETRLSVAEEDAITQAMNRRVEMFLVREEST